MSRYAFSGVLGCSKQAIGKDILPWSCDSSRDAGSMKLNGIQGRIASYRISHDTTVQENWNSIVLLICPATDLNTYFHGQSSKRTLNNDIESTFINHQARKLRCTQGPTRCCWRSTLCSPSRSATSARLQWEGVRYYLRRIRKTARR